MAKKPVSAKDLAPNTTQESKKIGELEAQLAKLQEAHDTLTASSEQHKQELIRLMAAKENAEKRMRKQLQNAQSYALLQFSKDLLPVVDSLNNALLNTKDEPQAQEGITLTLELINKIFSQYNIETLSPQGEVFDPQWHEAMSTQDNPEQENNTVLEVFQTGYRIKERLLRPALVVVNKRSST